MEHLPDKTFPLEYTGPWFNKVSLTNIFKSHTCSKFSVFSFHDFLCPFNVLLSAQNTSFKATITQIKKNKRTNYKFNQQHSEKSKLNNILRKSKETKNPLTLKKDKGKQKQNQKQKKSQQYRQRKRKQHSKTKFSKKRKKNVSSTIFS